ncbi:MAG TPA: hypothetical protein VHJ39_04235 [Solirubrobacteraceae bacterium]|nr:hypothetical protein [Solirubrobacteraceae bacterium]
MSVTIREADRVKTRDAGAAPGDSLRLAPLTGVVATLLVIAGIVVMEGVADRPEESAPPDVVLAYFRDRDAVMGGSALYMLGGLFFIWFAGELRSSLRRAEGRDGRVSAIAFGAGVATGTLMLLIHAASFLGALYHEQLSPETARTLFLYPMAMTGALLLAATAAVALRTKILPKWLAWLSLPVALWLLVPPFGSPAGTDWAPPAWSGLAALGALPFWTIATAIALTIRGRGR